MLGKLSLEPPKTHGREEYKNEYGVFSENYNSHSNSYSTLPSAQMNDKRSSGVKSTNAFINNAVNMF